jgi:glycosyltransferase involved in cell wall biosynthesis
MKILVIEKQPSSRRGGQEWCLLETCRGLAQRGHDITLVYVQDGDFLKSYQEFCTSLIQVPCFRVSRDQPFTSSINWLKSVVHCSKLNPELIYTNHYNDIFFSALLAQLKRVPLVCHLHVFPPKRFGIQCSIGLRTVTRFIAVSKATRAAFLQAGFDPATIKLVYNGTDLQRFQPKNDRVQTRQHLNIPFDAFTALYAGRIDPPKNIEMLLRSFAQLGKTSEQARLLIVGNPVNHPNQEAGQAYLRSLKYLCTTLNIQDQVHWLGVRSNLPELYRAADVTVLPSLLPDTFGRVLAESMACGTPALGLRFGGIPEVLSGEFERFQIDVDNLDSLTNLLRSLENWQQQDLTLGERCCAYIKQRFPPERALLEIERVFEQSIELGPARLGPSKRTIDAWNGEDTEFCERT